MTAPKEVKELVERFERNLEEYKSGRYNETQLRREFLDPFFEALGWDVNNKQGHAPAYRDVIHEDSISIGEWTKSPDYCFRVGKERKFFLEAKKPSINVKEDISPAYQLRRYAWSAKLSLSILSDFEEFAVYDCRIKPVKTNGAAVARIMYFTYKDYINKWDEISGIFSREAVLKGSFDKYAESGKKKRGTAEVDDEFLKEIESWREILAKNIAANNPKLSTRELNYAVQSTIDRIIFLRICEDRRIEDYARLMALQNGENAYPRLCELFRQADDKYNSGLFHFSEEKGRTGSPDTLALKLKIDDKPIKEIIKGLYYPDSPYQFDYMPIEILGQVYEQFLGKVIRLEDHRAVIEEKPEVRKAGGVYYTPKYIVDYIVKNTVGKLLEGKTPKQAAKIKILDPACGSGSFLIGAYQYLLDWHREWYENDGALEWAKKKSPVLYQDAHGEWQLTIAEKKRIMLNNIFGVDIDSQAVEVTKLSLLLKILEGETSQTINSTLRLFHERALPDLGNNIKCGNSLIGPDFYDNRQTSFLNEEEKYRVNAFDWKTEFKKIMDEGGFDAVIGNPPYRSLLLGKKQESEEKKIILYYEKVFPNSAQYKINLFGLFIEKCAGILSPKGLFSFIIPNLFYTSYYFKDLREFLVKKGRLIKICDLRYRVFTKAETGGNGIFVFTPNKSTKYSTICIAKSFDNFKNPTENIVDSEIFSKDTSFSLLTGDKFQSITQKIQKITTVELGKICTIYQGIITGNNKKYLTENPNGKKWEKIIRGRDIGRYSLNYGGMYVYFDPKVLWSNTNRKMFEIPEKLISRQTSDHLIATLDTEKYLSLDSTHVIQLKSPLFSIKYLLGIYNSRLLNYLYASRVREEGRTFAQVKVINLNPLPIYKIDPNDPHEKKNHNKMVGLVEEMLDLHKNLIKAEVPHDKEAIQRQIDTTDKQIDQLVYKLYGLTEEEIGVVEGKTNG